MEVRSRNSLWARSHRRVAEQTAEKTLRILNYSTGVNGSGLGRSTLKRRLKQAELRCCNLCSSGDIAIRSWKTKFCFSRASSTSEGTEFRRLVFNEDWFFVENHQLALNTSIFFHGHFPVISLHHASRYHTCYVVFNISLHGIFPCDQLSILSSLLPVMSHSINQLVSYQLPKSQELSNKVSNPSINVY